MSLTIREVFDAHLHLRDGEMMQKVVRHLGPVWGGIIMPNLDPPVRFAEEATDYRRRIVAAAAQAGKEFKPVMTIYLTPETKPADIWKAYNEAGVSVLKAYPKGRTTNAQYGISRYWPLTPVLELMQTLGMVLCIHGEHPLVEDERMRETAFLGILTELAQAFPALAITLEHASTRVALDTVRQLPNVAASITAHHLVLTREDVYNPPDPHNKCMPIAKTQEDRQALIEAATSGDPQFFLGSDCAPHPREKKETGSIETAASGVYVGGVMLPVLAQVFEDAGQLEKLSDFAGKFGPEWYGLDPSDREVSMVKEPWVVPSDYEGIVPLYAGKTLNWRVN